MYDLPFSAFQVYIDSPSQDLFEGDVAEYPDDFLGEETSSHITSCLFPVRYTPCIEDEELLEGAPYSTETQKDKDALARIVKLVEESGGKLDTTKMTFRWVHALHPSRATNVGATSFYL